jgi:hypothetical protein
VPEQSGSIWQSSEQPSKGIVFPSSQPSVPSFLPSPHSPWASTCSGYRCTCTRVRGGKRQSIHRQLMVFPSSQASEPPTTPSPHMAETDGTSNELASTPISAINPPSTTTVCPPVSSVVLLASSGKVTAPPIPPAAPGPASGSATPCPPVPLDVGGRVAPPAPPGPLASTTGPSPPTPFDVVAVVVPPDPPSPPESTPGDMQTQAAKFPADVQVWDPFWPVGQGQPMVMSGTHLAPSPPPPQPPRRTKQRNETGTQGLNVMLNIVAPFGLWRNLQPSSVAPFNRQAGLQTLPLRSTAQPHEGPPSPYEVPYSGMGEDLRLICRAVDLYRMNFGPGGVFQGNMVPSAERRRHRLADRRRWRRLAKLASRCSSRRNRG